MLCVTYQSLYTTSQTLRLVANCIIGQLRACTQIPYTFLCERNLCKYESNYTLAISSQNSGRLQELFIPIPMNSNRHQPQLWIQALAMLPIISKLLENHNYEQSNYGHLTMPLYQIPNGVFKVENHFTFVSAAIYTHRIWFTSLDQRRASILLLCVIRFAKGI